MNSAKPPRLAAWILQHFGPEFNQEALSGDLNEAFQQGRSKGWYWRQVLAAIRWGALLYTLLIRVAWSWWLTRPRMWHDSPMLSRSLDMAVFTSAFLALRYVPRMLGGKLRALLTVLITLFFCLLFRFRYEIYYHYSILGLFLLYGLVFHQKTPASPPYHLTISELMFGDPDAERQRLMEKLHLAMLQETDPEVRHAYAESIAALKSKASPAVKAVE